MTEMAASSARQPRLRVIIAACIGSALEWYDFFLYGTAAALVFGDLFFPRSDPIVGTLLSFLTFGVGFVVRPLGGIFFGILGDAPAPNMAGRSFISSRTRRRIVAASGAVLRRSASRSATCLRPAPLRW